MHLSFGTQTRPAHEGGFLMRQPEAFLFLDEKILESERGRYLLFERLSALSSQDIPVSLLTDKERTLWIYLDKLFNG